MGQSVFMTSQYRLVLGVRHGLGGGKGWLYLGVWRLRMIVCVCNVASNPSHESKNGCGLKAPYTLSPMAMSFI
jgi:hypothetical protein